MVNKFEKVNFTPCSAQNLKNQEKYDEIKSFTHARFKESHYVGIFKKTDKNLDKLFKMPPGEFSAS